MLTKSISDKTLVFWNFFLFAFLASTMSVLFVKTDYFQKVAAGSTKHIVLGTGYLTIFICFPFWVLSRTLTKFIVTTGQIKVIDWFGLRNRTYSLPTKKSLKIKSQTTPHRFRHFPVSRKNYEYRTLYLTTAEGRKLKIQSRYYKDFDELNVAVRKGCY